MILNSAASRAVFAENGNGALFWSLMELGTCQHGPHSTLWHSGLLKQSDIKLDLPRKRAPPDLELCSQSCCKRTRLEPSLLCPSVAALLGPAQKPACCSRITLAQICSCPAIPHTSGGRYWEYISPFYASMRGNSKNDKIQDSPSLKSANGNPASSGNKIKVTVVLTSELCLTLLSLISVCVHWRWSSW